MQILNAFYHIFIIAFWIRGIGGQRRRSRRSQMKKAISAKEGLRRLGAADESLVLVRYAMRSIDIVCPDTQHSLN